MASSSDPGEVLALLRAAGVPDADAIVAERGDGIARELERTRLLRERDFGETPPTSVFVAGWDS